jgi:hypothetical protein
MPYTWNAGAARYTGPTGRFVARDDVRHAFDRVIERAGERMRRATDQMRGGELTLRQWQELMRSELKSLHLQSAAAARGGFGQLTQRDYGRVGRELRSQYEYLHEFTKDLRAGRAPTDGRVLGRAELYAKSARAAYHEAHEQQSLDEAGYTEERSLLHAAEHCVQCIDQAALGWVPRGTLVPIGRRQCLGNCRCTMRYR